ncbi:MAG: CpaD family pilus assembly protein [Proteobacteria bacterium]|nr:CpaD family pilus assembly protein [Pseudomonadota bacterium]
MPSRLPLALLGLSALGACATSAIPPAHMGPVASRADSHVIAVTQTSARLEIDVAPGDTALTDKARTDLSRFAAAYLRYGHGALILSTPSGGANANAASMLAGQTRTSLMDAGVSYNAVAGSTYDAGDAANAPIVVSFARFEAEAPNCRPIYEQDLAHQEDNQAWESFGCAMQANLAAMVEDPADLLHPRADGPRDSNRRGTVMGHYRAGEVTHATRDNDERATVSNVASQ